MQLFHVPVGYNSPDAISWKGGLYPGLRGKVARVLSEGVPAQKSGAGDFPPPALGEHLPQTWREAGWWGLE